jgi:hypothetical protein
VEDKKKKIAANIISFRVTDDELASIREVMKATRQNASAVMRQFIKPWNNDENLNR